MRRQIIYSTITEYNKIMALTPTERKPRVEVLMPVQPSQQPHYSVDETNDQPSEE